MEEFIYRILLHDRDYTPTVVCNSVLLKDINTFISLTLLAPLFVDVLYIIYEYFHREFGGWEKHTRGIGQRLLAMVIFVFLS